MANHSTMFLDDKDIAELDAKLLEYKSSTMGTPKDGGVKNLDGIDGVLDSTSTALSALTGYLTVMFEGTTEAEVNAKFRKFKQYISQKSFWKMSVPQDKDFFKYGKFVGQAEMPDLTDVPSYAQSSLIVKLSIQFKNAYEYSKLAIESKATGNIISVSNPGRPTRDAVITIKSDNQLSGFVKITSEAGDVIEFGTESIMFYVNSTIKVDLGRFEMTRIMANNQVNNIFSYIKTGRFFKIPSGTSSIQIEYKARTADEWSTQIPFSAEIELSPSYY